MVTRPIAPWPESLLRTRLRKVRAGAGYSPDAQWNPGSLRDAFCSYHLAHYGSVFKLTTEAGHTSLRTTRDHYLGLVGKEEAAEFWSLYPPGRGKVIPFARKREPGKRITRRVSAWNLWRSARSRFSGSSTAW
jgi:hypothetical protein